MIFFILVIGKSRDFALNHRINIVIKFATSWELKKMPYLFFTLIISVIVAMFAVQNAVSVSLNFAVWTMQTSLVIVILGSALLGALAALFFTLMMKAKHYLQDKKLREELAGLKKDNDKLREEVAMLMHTQKLHTEAAVKTEPAAPAAAE